MNLDKAIELSKEAEFSLRHHKFFDYADAVKMGSEALKRLQNIRGIDSTRPITLLPGEDAE